MDTALALRDQAQVAQQRARAAEARLQGAAVEHEGLLAEHRDLRRRMERQEEELATLRRALAEVQTVEAPVADTEDAEIDGLRRQVDDLRADVVNIRRHQQDAVARASAEARLGGLLVLADSVDDLGRACDQVSDRAVAEGLRALQGRLVRRLHDAGLERFGDPGEAFDPERHEAIGLSLGPSGAVVAVERPGLTEANGRVVRPALVVVGDGRKA